MSARSTTDRPPRERTAWLNQRTAPYVFVAPFVLLFALFTTWPLLQSLVLAFQQTFGPRATAWVGLDNFRFLLNDPQFWTALRNTVVFALCSVTIQLPLALGLALLLNRPGLRGRALYRMVFFAPNLVGLVFTGVLFALVFEKRTGLLNASLHALFPAFDPEFPWLQIHVMPALVIAALWIYTGFNMVYFLAALQSVPQDTLEAARIDGAGPWDRFRHVIWPEIRPVAGFVVLLSTVGSFQLYELPQMLLDGAGPQDRGLTIVMYLMQQGFQAGDLGYASAIGWVLALILLSVTIVQRRLARNEAH
jgi:ABC-type sugar transport system permease subunit